MFTLETTEITWWEDANNLVLIRLLAVLSNRLFDVYVNFTNAKQLWDELDEKYFEGDNGNESFITATYLNGISPLYTLELWPESKKHLQLQNRPLYTPNY